MKNSNIMVMDAYDNKLAYTNKALLWEYHEQDLGASQDVTTNLDEVLGAVPINSSSSAASTAYTDGAITSSVVTVTGTATKFLLVGRFTAVEA